MIESILKLNYGISIDKRGIEFNGETKRGIWNNLCN